MNVHEDLIDVDMDTLYRAVKDLGESHEWNIIKRKVIEVWGGFKNLNIIEVGAGKGKMSILMNLLGANTTLIEKDEEVMQHAKLAHKAFGCKSNYILADAMALPAEMFNEFNISMSFGTVEHFVGKERQEILDIHFSLLKNKGLSLIHVPNKWGIFYRIAFAIWKLLGSWPKDLPEIPFTHSELKKRGSQAGYKDMTVVGCSTITSDFRSFILHNLKSRLLKIFYRKSPEKTFHAKTISTDKQDKLLNIIKGEAPRFPLKPGSSQQHSGKRISFVNNYFGYILLLIAYKK